MSEPMVAQLAQTSWATGSSPSRPAGSDRRRPPWPFPWPWRPPVMELVVVLPAAAEVLGVLVDGVPVGPLGPGRLGHRLPPAGAVGEHPQPLGFQHVGVVHPGVAGGVVGQRRARWLLAVAVAVALIAQILRVMAGPI